MAVIRAENLHKIYGLGRSALRALDGVDLSIDEGEFIALTGPSGCGKTTLLNCLSGIDRPDKGKVFLEGEDLVKMNETKRTRHRNRHMGFVFQSFNLVPVLNARDNVALPLRLGGMRGRQAAQLAIEALARVGLGDRGKHFPNQLSGGQQQRVAVARAIVHEPRVVWADEPTGNLDATNGRQVLDLFQELNQAGTTFVMVTHDTNVAGLADRQVALKDGRIQ